MFSHVHVSVTSSLSVLIQHTPDLWSGYLGQWRDTPEVQWPLSLLYQNHSCSSVTMQHLGCNGPCPAAGLSLGQDWLYRSATVWEDESIYCCWIGLKCLKMDWPQRNLAEGSCSSGVSIQLSVLRISQADMLTIIFIQFERMQDLNRTDNIENKQGKPIFFFKWKMLTKGI